MLGEDIDYKIFKLEPCHWELFKDFDCSNIEINNFLNKADKEYKDGMSLTKLIINNNGEKVIGYYTLLTTSLIFDTKDKNKIKGLPAVEIKMFAIDISYQNMSYSEEYEDGTFADYLFLKLLSEIRTISETSLGIKYILLNSIPTAENFYAKNYFSKYENFMINMYDKFIEGCTPMYMSIE